MDIGPQLVELRTALGYTQEYVAEASGYSQSYIAMLESGQRTATWENLRRIAPVLQVTVEALLRHASDPEVPVLTEQELAHFRDLRSLPPEAQRELEQFTQYLRAKHAGGKRRPGHTG